MSRLTDLIAQAKAGNAQLGADLEREFKALSSRLPFGLNFERHRPEAVELPQRPLRKGDSKGFKFWYRNPARPSQDSLGVAYEDGDDMKILRPDFLFFAQLPDGRLVVDLIDPHGIHLADAVPKLQGLARYAEAHPGAYRRIESVAESGGRLRVLDLTRAEVRKSVAEAKDAKSLYESALASDYK